MKVPFSWIKELVDIKVSAKDAAAKLSLAGIECSASQTGLLEADILPNRGDCLSVIGLAREFSAVFNTPLKFEAPKLVEKAPDISGFASVEVKDQDLCPRYMARVITGIQIKPSPEWMQKRLLECGMRPINNIVDATNYILLETGQPMHAFDLKDISDKKIIVRRAKSGEKIVTLDEVERTLTDKDLLICDGAGPVAIAGVMGGRGSEVSSLTKDILIESAYFDPSAINKTSKELKLRTEASGRFEKGVDWDGVSSYLDRAASLIEEISGGKASKGKIDVKSRDRLPKEIKLRMDRIKKILGIEVPKTETILILERLGFLVQDKIDTLEVKVPLFRAGDIEREIDLIEEVIRIHGYDKVPETRKVILNSSKNELEDTYDIKKASENMISEVLLGSGFNEAKTYSMIGEKLYKKALVSLEDAVKIDNPLIDEMTHLRTTLLPGLLEAAEYNNNRQEHDIAIFEFGKVFKATGSKPVEKNAAAALLTGSVYKGMIENDRLNQDLYFMKGLLENIFDGSGIKDIVFEISADPHSEPGMSTDIFAAGIKIGFLSKVNKKIQDSFGLSKPVFVFEIDTDVLSKKEITGRIYRESPKFPSVRRDIAMFLPEGVIHSTIIETIKQAGGKLVEDTDVFDKFESKGKKSLAYYVIYRDLSKTLTDEEVNLVHKKVIICLETKLGVEIRK